MTLSVLFGFFFLTATDSKYQEQQKEDINMESLGSNTDGIKYYYSDHSSFDAVNV